MRVCFYTLGCKVNQYETSALAELFTQNGYMVVQPDEQADVYILNSCTVTNLGDQKSRRWLRGVKRDHPGAVTVLTGCWPQAFPDKAATFPYADVITGSTNRARILEDVQKVLDGSEERVIDIHPFSKGECFEELPLKQIAGHTRAFVKVEDGCDRACAYCVIPRARGPVRSRSIDSVLEELNRLAQNGYREAVLTGINLSSYGRDTGSCLAELVEKAATVPHIERLRLGSLEPDMLSEQDISRFAAVSKLCPHFHLSLQSGCDRTLLKMHRPYKTALFVQKVSCLRKAFGEKAVGLTTDVIVGFPGETEEDFAQSLSFVTAQNFLKVHVFPYSRREGTPAFTMPDQIPQNEKASRSRRMQGACEEMRACVAASFAGQKAEILLEKQIAPSQFTGYTRQYLPVLTTAPGHKSGDLVTVTLGAWEKEQDHCMAQAEF